MIRGRGKPGSMGPSTGKLDCPQVEGQRGSETGGTGAEMIRGHQAPSLLTKDKGWECWKLLPYVKRSSLVGNRCPRPKEKKKKITLQVMARLSQGAWALQVSASPWLLRRSFTHSVQGRPVEPGEAMAFGRPV